MNLYDNFNKIILNIKDPNLKFTGLANNSQKQSITLEAIATFGKRPNCIRCGSSDVEYHGYTTNKVFCLSPDPSKPLHINLHKQRAKCLKCGKSFQKESPELVKKYKNISNQVNQRVISELMSNVSMKEISLHNNISQTQVARILDKTIVFDYRQYESLPKHLCFDEVRTKKHNLSFIAIDGITHRIVCLLPGRTSAEILGHFKRYSFKVRCQVKTVTVDMNASYASLVKKLFPNAKLIIDRFHIIQMLNRAFNKQRVRVMKQYPHSTYEYNIFKCFWKLFLVDYALLDYKIPKYRRNLKTFLTDAQIVSEALTLNDELFLSYEIVHRIHNYIINHDVLNLTRFFNKFEELKQNLINARRRWTLENKNRDYPLKLRKLDNYIIIALHTLTSKTNKQGVLNACSKEYQQFNNGGIEGINRRIKLTEREGFGITNFDHLRKRLILQINYRVERKKESKKIK